MKRHEGLNTSVDGLCCREGSISFCVKTLILEDTRIVASECRVEILADTPAGVEEVENVLHIDAELKLVGILACLDGEVVLIAEVKSVNPRRIQAVGLCVLALVGTEIFIVVHVIKETGCVIL